MFWSLVSESERCKRLHIESSTVMTKQAKEWCLSGRWNSTFVEFSLPCALAFYHESASEQHTILEYGLSDIVWAWCISTSAHISLYILLCHLLCFIYNYTKECEASVSSPPREKFWIGIDDNRMMQTVESILYYNLLKYNILNPFLFILLYKLIIVYYSRRFYTYFYA